MKGLLPILVILLLVSVVVAAWPAINASIYVFGPLGVLGLIIVGGLILTGLILWAVLSRTGKALKKR